MLEQVRHDGWWLAVLALFFAVLALPAAAQTFPKYTGLVVDAGNVLPPAVEQDLTAKLEALQKDTKRQLVVVTVPDTRGEALEVYANQLFRSWGVGLRDINNGAMLLIAPGNPAGQRGPRIEVGYGLEPVLTDALSSVIIRQRMMPLIRQDVPGAVTAGADAIIQQLRAAPEEAQARQDAAIREFDRTHQRGGRASGSTNGFAAGVIGIMIFAFILLAFSRSRAGRSGVRGGGRRYRGHDDDSGLGSVILWSIANEVASSAFRNSGRGGWSGGGGSGWGGGGGGGSDGSWGGGGFTGGGGGDSGGGGASGDW
jgi:uncharacterized protein